MGEVAAGIAAFVRWTDEQQLLPNPTARDVLTALRGHLNATVPG